jgi:phage gp29-like protein
MIAAEDKKPLLDAEIAPISKDITRPYVSGLLLPQDKILREKGGLTSFALDIYEKIANDAYVGACYQQRFRKLTRCKIDVKARGKRKIDKDAADWIRALIEAMPMDDITEKLMWGLHYGYSVADKKLTRDSKGMVTLDPEKGFIEVLDRRRFRFDQAGKPRLLTLHDMFEGEEMHPSRIWKASFGGNNHSDPYGLGRGSLLYWPTLIKRGDIRHWLEFLEQFARPSSEVTYPSGASPEEKAKAQELAQAIRSGSAVSHSDGFVMQLIEAGRSGTADFQGLYNMAIDEITLVILSQTGTTQNGAWAGTADTHANVADDLTASDGDLFNQSFCQYVVKPLVESNFEGAAIPLAGYKTIADEDINLRIDRETKLFNIGAKPSPELIEDVYGQGYEIAANQVLLDGAQLQAMTALLESASLGRLPADSLIEILKSTLGIPEEIAAKIADPIRELASSALSQQAALGDPSIAPNLPPQRPQALTQAANPQSPNNAPQPAFSEFAEASKNDTVVAFVEQLRKKAQPELKKMVGQIKATLDGCSDLTEFREKLDGIYPDLDGETLTKVMAEAMFASKLAGIFEAQEEL